MQLINSVTEGGPGLVAVGQDDPAGSAATGWVDSDAAVWVSADGYTWTRVPHDEAVFGGPDGQRMMSVTAGGPGLVAVGSDYRDGSGWPDVAVWVSADGYTWTRVPHDQAIFGGQGGQEVLSVTEGGPGLVAVGSVDSYASAAVWVSADGYTWTRVPHDEAVFGGPGTPGDHRGDGGGARPGRGRWGRLRGWRCVGMGIGRRVQVDPHRR